MLVVLKRIASEQANSTQATEKSLSRLLNYAVTHSEAITIYHASGMVLYIHSSASFLSEPEAKIRAGEYHYISIKSTDPNKAPLNQPLFNGPVHTECKTTRNVLDIAMESELVALFINCQGGAEMHMVLT